MLARLWRWLVKVREKVTRAVSLVAHKGLRSSSTSLNVYPMGIHTNNEQM